jgi:hypothetical protein
MSYQPFERNPSGIVFFGSSSTDQVYESSTGFTFGDDILTVPNITIGDNGEIGSATTPAALVISSDGSITIAGDLTVNGTETILNTETLEVEDNIVLLNKGITGSPSLDAGIEVERGTASNVFFTYDEGDNNWHFTNDGTNYIDMWTGLAIGADVGSDEIITEGATLTVSGGSGVTTNVDGNTISVAVDSTVISDKTVLTSVDSNDDYLLVFDGTDSSLKKVTKGNFVSDLGGGTVTSVAISGTDGIDVDSGSPITGAGTITLGLSNVANDKLANSSLTIAADSGTSEDAALGETVTISGGDVVDTAVSTDNTVTVNVKYDGVTIGKNSSNQLEVLGLNKTVGTPSNGDTITEDINLVSSGSANVTVTLPAPSSGKLVTVKKIDSGAGGVVVSKNNADTIDGASSKILYHRYESITVVSDGTDWFIV